MFDRIYTYGEKILRKRLMPVSRITSAENKLFEEMLVMMRSSSGIGLAANQIGLDKQMFVVEAENTTIKLANPKIIKKSNYDVLEEGCLSLPGVSVKVKRASQITCRGLNEHNQKVDIQASGILARAIQHEVDHLNGRLIIDYANFWQKLAIKKRIREISDQ